MLMAHFIEQAVESVQFNFIEFLASLRSILMIEFRQENLCQQRYTVADCTLSPSSEVLTPSAFISAEVRSLIYKSLLSAGCYQCMKILQNICNLLLLRFAIQQISKYMHQDLPKQASKIITLPPKNQHKHTIIWIHGLSETPQQYLYLFNNPLFKDFKVIAPGAPIRKVTVSTTGNPIPSWFDVKFRNQSSFTVPFEQAFNVQQIYGSFEYILKPIIDSARQQLEKNKNNGKLFIAGFSQGCNMSLYSFFSCRDKIDAVIGISGFLFPIVPFWPTDRYHHVLYGTEDKLRPWEYGKHTFYGKIGMQNITLVPNTGHQINQAMAAQFYKRIEQVMQPIRVAKMLPKSGNHKHTLIWIHGLNYKAQHFFYMFQNPIFNDFKILAPQAPVRHVTIFGSKCTSWYDIKFRNQNSFKVDFDQAFSSKEIKDSFDNILQPLICKAKEQLDKANENGKLIVAGFSQGGGLSLHCLFSQKDKVNAAIDFSGYLFPFTPVQQTDRYLHVIYGKADKIRPWEQTKQVYKDKISQDRITLIQNMDHEINSSAAQQFYKHVQQILKQ